MEVFKIGSKEFNFGKKKKLRSMADVLSVLLKYDTTDHVKKILSRADEMERLRKTFKMDQLIEDNHYKAFPSIVEYAVIPHNMDITRHLSVREMAGFYIHNEINVERIKAYHSGIAHSGISVYPIGTKESFCSLYWYFSILQDLALIITESHNPMRPPSYKDEFKHRHFEKYIEDRTKREWGIAIIFNIYMMLEEKLVNSAKNRLQEYLEKFPLK